MYLNTNTKYSICILNYKYIPSLGTSGGYWVRRMRHSPQAPLENSIYSFGFAADVCSEDDSE